MLWLTTTMAKVELKMIINHHKVAPPNTIHNYDAIDYAMINWLGIVLWYVVAKKAIFWTERRGWRRKRKKVP